MKTTNTFPYSREKTLEISNGTLDCQNMEGLRFRVRGLVQGVGFRQFTLKIALGLGVKGWVRNRTDGTVEGLAVASRDLLDMFLKQIQKGPLHSRVDQIESNSEVGPFSFTTFTIEASGDDT